MAAISTKGIVICRWTMSPCWHRAMRDSIIPLLVTCTLVPIAMLVFLLLDLLPTPLTKLDLFLLVALCLTLLFVTVGSVVLWRCFLYLKTDYIRWLNNEQGQNIRIKNQHIEACLKGFHIKALFDRPSHDFRRLAGVHTSKTLDRLLDQYPGITFVAAPNSDHPSQYFLDRCGRFMLRISHIDLYWLAKLGQLTGATFRLMIDRNKLQVKPISDNAVLNSVIENAKENITIEGSLLEVTVSPSWLRIRVIGGTWLGRTFEERIKEGIVFGEDLIRQLGQRYEALPPEQWTLDDRLETIPFTR